MSPQAVRVRTSSGWQDIALQGAQGPAGSTPSSKAYGLFTYSGADNAHRIYTPTMTGKPWDEIGGFPAVGQPLIFTCPKAGRYSVLTKIAQVSNVGQINVSPIVNDSVPGNGVTAQINVKADGSETGGCEVLCILDLAVGNTVKLFSSHSGGGTAYIIYEIIQLAGLPGPIAGAPPYVTPTQFASLIPVDGQEVYLQVDAANGIVWHLRYNAASASAYKWEYLGGPPLYSETRAQALCGATYAASGDPLPNITLPSLAGDYEIHFGSNAYSLHTAVQSVYHGIALSATEADDAAAIISQCAANGGPGRVNAARKWRITLPAGTQCRTRIRAPSGNAYVSDRWLAVTPVRVG
jgi:hypothetical protein